MAVLCCAVLGCAVLCCAVLRHAIVNAHLATSRREVGQLSMAALTLRRMKWFLMYCILYVAFLGGETHSFKHAMTTSTTEMSTKLFRDARKAFSTGILAASLFAGSTQKAFADNDIPIYFGVGCFWHVQHEFAATEVEELGRDIPTLTAKAGYAGGNRKAKPAFNPANPSKPIEDLVCYHNLQGVADYDALGYTEVVGMNVPSNKVDAFASEYFSLFGKDSERPDKGDRGGQYRSVIGVPGGMKGESLSSIQNALDKSGKDLKLVEGKGNEPDTLGKKVVYVMDSNVFPFKQAELYHQFHDGFMPGEQYGKQYHDIAKALVADGRLKVSQRENEKFYSSMNFSQTFSN